MASPQRWLCRITTDLSSERIRAIEQVECSLEVVTGGVIAMAMRCNHQESERKRVVTAAAPPGDKATPADRPAETREASALTPRVLASYSAVTIQ